MSTIKRKERILMSQGDFNKLPSILKDRDRVCVVVHKKGGRGKEVKSDPSLRV